MNYIPYIRQSKILKSCIILTPHSIPSMLDFHPRGENPEHFTTRIDRWFEGEPISQIDAAAEIFT